MFWLDRKLTLYIPRNKQKIHCAWKTFKSHKWELTFKINTNSYKDSLNFVQVSPAILPGLKRWSICLLIPSLGFPSLICNERLKRLDSSQVLTFRLDDNKLRLISHWYLEIINSSGTFSTWVCPALQHADTDGNVNSVTKKYISMYTIWYFCSQCCQDPYMWTRENCQLEGWLEVCYWLYIICQTN